MIYNHQHQFYCGVDLHARFMFTHILSPWTRQCEAATIRGSSRRL